MFKVKICKTPGCKNPVWSNGKCKSHIAKKPMKSRGVTLKTSREGTKKFDKALKSKVMHEFFIKLWKVRAHKSEISGAYLGKEPLSIFFHHILPKSKFEMASLDPENIIFMTPDEHNNVENDMYRYDEVNERRETLHRKYDLI